MPDLVDYTSLFAEHRPRLLGLAYRMTGSFCEAEDLVQETFARALQRPPADPSRPWGPWLHTITVRLAIDTLRRRQHRGYTGPYLPAPLDAETVGQLQACPRGGDQRYEMLDSLSFAFMLALESLSATQRAVLVLRDALGFSGAETADMLEISPQNVRATLLRARRVMQEHHRAQQVPDPLRQAQALALLQRFMQAAASGNVDEIIACLTEDVALLADGGGRYVSPLRPLQGRDPIIRFVLGILGKTQGFATAWADLNGAPAVLLTAVGATVAKAPPRTAFRIELDPSGGRIETLYLISNPEKIQHLSFPPAGATS